MKTLVNWNIADSNYVMVQDEQKILSAIGSKWQMVDKKLDKGASRRDKAKLERRIAGSLTAVDGAKFGNSSRLETILNHIGSIEGMNRKVWDKPAFADQTLSALWVLYARAEMAGLDDAHYIHKSPMDKSHRDWVLYQPTKRIKRTGNKSKLSKAKQAQVLEMAKIFDGEPIDWNEVFDSDPADFVGTECGNLTNLDKPEQIRVKKHVKPLETTKVDATTCGVSFPQTHSIKGWKRKGYMVRRFDAESGTENLFYQFYQSNPIETHATMEPIYWEFKLDTKNVKLF